MMEQSQLIKIITKLKFAYPYYFKDMNESDTLAFVSLYQEQLGEFSYLTLDNAINYLIKNNEYMPSIAEIYQYCKKHYKYKKNETIEEMIRTGYFLTDEEIDKAYQYIETGNIPKWFLDDFTKFKTKLIEEKGK